MGSTAIMQCQEAVPRPKGLSEQPNSVSPAVHLWTNLRQIASLPPDPHTTGIQHEVIRKEHPSSNSAVLKLQK